LPKEKIKGLCPVHQFEYEQTFAAVFDEAKRIGLIEDVPETVH